MKLRALHVGTKCLYSYCRKYKSVTELACITGGICVKAKICIFLVVSAAKTLLKLHSKWKHKTVIIL